MTEPVPIDVRHLGREHVICCWRVGGVLIDPGPESCVETLLAGLPDGYVPDAILLTHIHFDHAGGSGALVRRFPGTPVYVHERGAPHMIDPERLVSSARRLYGEDFDRLWGEVVPLEDDVVHVLSGGETLELAGETFEVAYTPGHAKHHVCYLHRGSRMAFCGDVAGVRVLPATLPVAPTPPPDIDVPTWERSIDTVLAWEPGSLGITHFGLVEDPVAQLEGTRANLRGSAELARELDVEPFVEATRALLATAADEETAAAYIQAASPEQLWLGMRRYWDQVGEGKLAAPQPPDAGAILTS